MFKKLKDKIEEEFKQAPLKFPVSVQQLAQAISPSPSVNSLSENNANSSVAYPTDVTNVSTEFFSIGGDEDSVGGITKMPMGLHSVDLTATSPSNMTQNVNRSRQSSFSSVTSDNTPFPYYESGFNQNLLQSDIESEMEDGMSGQIEKISKEQLYQSFKKVLNRYNKYKGKYTELMKHCRELQHENFKTKNILQESQDKALRRMSELREQCQLEQKAKAHLEESLRNDMEERDHIIDTLKTKISLLTKGENNAESINLRSDQNSSTNAELQSNELLHLKSQNSDLQQEVERLKKIKETACHLIHRYDTTINEATEDVKSDHLKQKMSELKSEIQKMKSENESLSHLLSRNIISEDEKKNQIFSGNVLVSDLLNVESSQDDQKMDEKDKRIEKLNNLLLKCKEKINGLNAEIKAKNMIIESVNKKVDDLKEEIRVIKVREEENALTVAENKKAIHDELDAKEEQIKALTKELKTKENEFIKEKEEILKYYENKMREMNSKFTKEMNEKNEQTKKLVDDLRAKQTLEESWERLKAMENSLANMTESIKARSCTFEQLAASKTNEIEQAQQKLSDRFESIRKNIADLVQNQKSKEKPEKEFKQQKIKGFEEVNMENKENLHTVEKLKSEVVNLCKKIEMLESELAEFRNQSKGASEEIEELKGRCHETETENEKLKQDFNEQLKENTELKKILKSKNEEFKQIENEKELLRNASKEKIEVESKLGECVEKYNKLEKENQSLQNKLMEKCEKLQKELNESKEKARTLEEEGNSKAKELELVKKKNLAEQKKKFEEIEELKKNCEKFEAQANDSQQKISELEKLKAESNELRVAAAENTKTKLLLENKIDEISKLKKELECWNEKEKDMNRIKEENADDKETIVHLKKELEEVKGKLNCELQEKKDKSVLVENLRDKCKLLMAQIDDLKKIHSDREKKLEEEIESIRKESNAQAEELESFKEKQTEHDAVEEIENLKRELLENEKMKKELSEKNLQLTHDLNEYRGEKEIKQNELDTLKKSFKALKDEILEKEKKFEEEKRQLMLENENKLNVLKNEIKFINDKHEEDIGNFEENINSEMKEANEKMVIAERTSAELLDKLEKVTSERDELKTLAEEKNCKISELEGCLMALKMELDEKFNENSKMEEQVDTKHSEEIKDIIMSYDKEIAQRDEEIESLKVKLTNDEDMQLSHREEVRRIIIQYDSEIAQRDDEIEALKSKLADNEKEFKSTKAEEVSEAESSTIREPGFYTADDGERSKISEETQRVLAEQKVKYEELLQKEKEERLSLRETLVKEKDQAVLEERQNWEMKLIEMKNKYERSKKDVGKAFQPQGESAVMQEEDCESISKLSVSPLGANPNSAEVLQRQLIQQATEMKELKKQYKKEILELKKISLSRRKAGKNSIDNQEWISADLYSDTEHEYLRNILYEYMMGKEQLVLAKVLSAIVKFNDEQTHNVLEKEQQRQTLFGQLGLL